MPDITINAADGSGSFSAYCAKPASGTGPGIVVLQEIFGVNRVMRDLCDGFATEGYIAVAPDLFWRIEPGVQLTDKSQEEWDRAFDLMNTFLPDFEKGVADIAATIRHVRGIGAPAKSVPSVVPWWQSRIRRRLCYGCRRLFWIPGTDRRFSGAVFQYQKPAVPACRRKRRILPAGSASEDQRRAQPE